ncbi:hypothetical protein FOXB_07540 [Fusarium oxysporum f. sp. conglutinans Fo5176]|uniref:AB hydrolase-1 domain-containing protein n=1 Tax=Fusarium oxysporum (strain Fo5176) TaxID=660025 RepID=F9FMB0_FUSOF|nr:hypothetical protein FOXB_07540 [Fusarium oxysporum f. sp. conglutinans Fo5176]
MTSSQNDPTALTQSFHYKTSTHSYDVKWGSLGDPKSPPLIFIHGTPWSSRVWVPFALSLSRQFHVYLFDRPGFGDTPAEQKLDPAKASSSAIEEYDSNLARQAEVFAALFKSWQKDWTHERAHVIAHDNAGLLFEQLPDTAFEGILESYISDAAYYELPKEIMQMLKEPWLREGGKRGFIRELCQANSRSTEEVEARYGEVGPKLPIKIIWGADDKWLPVEVAHRLGNALKTKEVIVIDKAGHLSMIDQGARVGVELGLWLSAAISK